MSKILKYENVLDMLSIKYDTFNRMVFKDEECVKMLIRLIYGVEPRILYHATQYSIERDGVSKGVVYDLLAETQDDVYIFELNNDKSKCLPQRVRAYLSNYDSYQLKKGDSYTKMKSVHVSFINMYKEPGRTEPIKRRKIMNVKGYEDLDYGIEFIDYNVTVPCTGEKADFSHDVFETCADDIIIPELKKVITYLKKGKGKDNMCEIIDELVKEELKTYEEKLKEKDRKIEVKDHELKEKDKEIEVKDYELKEKDYELKENARLISDMAEQMKLMEEENKKAREDAVNDILKEIGIPESQWNELKSRCNHMNIK